MPYVTYILIICFDCNKNSVFEILILFTQNLDLIWIQSLIEVNRVIKAVILFRVPFNFPRI